MILEEDAALIFSILGPLAEAGELDETEADGDGGHQDDSMERQLANLSRVSD